MELERTRPPARPGETNTTLPEARSTGSVGLTMKFEDDMSVRRNGCDIAQS